LQRRVGKAQEAWEEEQGRVLQGEEEYHSVVMEEREVNTRVKQLQKQEASLSRALEERQA